MTELDRPTVGGFYRHFKNRLYQVLHIAVHADTEEELVIYQALYGDFRVYARPLKDFMSEVDHEKYPDAMQKMRFVPVTLRRAEDVKVTESKPEEPRPDISKSKLETEKTVKLENMDVKPEKKTVTEPVNGVHPMLLAFLDADTIEERLRIFDEMADMADMHMLNAVAASLDISLSGTDEVGEAYELIHDNLVTQKKFECSRWR